MYKTKLQEVCHQRSWGLPHYSCVKDGPDHTPRFRASVFIDGVSYNSPTVSKSSKEALNDAAKFAFFRLTAGVEPTAEVPETDQACINSHSNPISSDVKVGKKHNQHKLKLQQFAKNKNLDPPLYTCKRKGPPHALQFQSTVIIAGKLFESPGYYGNLKEADHAAARIALMTLSQEVLQEIDAYCYKNLLQELVQNGALILAGYKTVAHGPPHKRTFYSNVEIQGEIFHGEGKKSKKLAELSAAKAAYLVFMERESAGDFDLTSSGSSQKISKPAFSVGSSPAIENEDEEDDFLTKSPINLKISSMCSTSKKGKLHVSTVAPPDLSSLSISSSKTNKKNEIGNYLLCNKVRVYTSVPTTKFPEGTVLLPIGDQKWIAVSLDFPNQKHN